MNSVVSCFYYLVFLLKKLKIKLIQNDILQRIDAKVNKVKNIFYCQHCNCLHKRVECDRLVDSARYCSKCRSYHSAVEHDLWSEKTGFWNNKINFYTCMENKVYNISELIKCRLGEVEFIGPNSHIVTGKIRREFKAKSGDLELASDK